MGKQITKTGVKAPDLKGDMANTINELARQEGIPPTGITIMAGRPYINVTGLDVKLKNLCEERKLELAGITAQRIVEPESDNGFLVGYHAEVILFDRENFVKALGKLGQVDRETLKELRDSFTYRYTGEGWASPDTCEGIGFKYVWKTINGKHVKTRAQMLLENIIMMAERRATNRAKREATGTGLTSVDELPMAQTEVTETEPIVPPPKEPTKPKKREDIFSTKVDAYVRSDEFKQWCKKYAILNMKEVKELLYLTFDKPMCEITLDEVKQWQKNIEGYAPELQDEGGELNAGQGEDIEGSVSGPEGAGTSTQGELLNDSD